MNIVDVWGNKTLECVLDALAKLNRGVDDLKIRAISGNASKALGAAHILNREFGVGIGQIEMKPLQFDGVRTFYIEVTLHGATVQARSPERGYKLPRSGFADFPVYHLLLDWWLFEGEQLQLFQGDRRLVAIRQDGTVDYDLRTRGVRQALCRCGLLWPSNWKEIASKLAGFDDVVLGVDTNVLYNCTLSEHLLPALSLVNPRGYAPTPNWILFVIPSGVMHELEEAANIRNDTGSLARVGRMGFRALQEVIELNQNVDIPGVSLLVAGEASPALDTRVELQGLRADLLRSQQGSGAGKLRPRKSSSGDMIIRSQFKAFLRQLDLHKGAHFLTADKSNAALARAEGLYPIYVRPPSNTPYRIRGRGDEVVVTVPIGKLIYEMAVQFRSITIRRGDRELEMKCDGKGERIDYWVYRNLQVDREGFEQLQMDYRGKFSLKRVRDVWARSMAELVGVEE